MMATSGTATPAAIAATLVLFSGAGDGVIVELALIVAVGDPREVVQLPIADELRVYQLSNLRDTRVGRLIANHIPTACRLVIRGNYGNIEQIQRGENSGRRQSGRWRACTPVKCINIRAWRGRPLEQRVILRGRFE